MDQEADASISGELQDRSKPPVTQFDIVDRSRRSARYCIAIFEIPAASLPVRPILRGLHGLRRQDSGLAIFSPRRRLGRFNVIGRIALGLKFGLSIATFRVVNEWFISGADCSPRGPLSGRK